jgi:magnesium transporter
MSLEKIKDLLSKHKLVENVVHSQSMRNHDLIEGMVHRQHLTELRNLLARMAPDDIASTLNALPLHDAQVVWGLIAEEGQNDVLWEMGDVLRQELAGEREPGFSNSQLSAFELRDGRLHLVTIASRRDLENLKPLWIDLLNANKPERTYIGRYFGLELPDPGDSIDLEVSSRFNVEENDEIHLHSNFLLDREGLSRSVPVVFILHQGILFTLRNEELPVFRLQRRRARTQQGYVTNCFGLLLDLYGADVEYTADSLEDIYAELGSVGRQVLSEKISDEEAAAILANIAELEDLNGRIRGNILDTQRALSFLMRGKVLAGEQIEDARQILRDIESLNSHTAFLFDKINFLMDATIGFININQNKRVSQLTVFGVVFMPINIMAGMGGMSEFSAVTQGIPWPISYGAFLLGMGLVGWMTYVALRHFEARRMAKKPGVRA